MVTGNGGDLLKQHKSDDIIPNTLVIPLERKAQQRSVGNPMICNTTAIKFHICVSTYTIPVHARLSKQDPLLELELIINDLFLHLT
mmetsp:Transcript_3258/g.3425  ORF Transcript_3258/g.3425 Transcript_3258/m.3425 type:complete len:86 (-) Transcript_3258:622-879(-)